MPESPLPSFNLDDFNLFGTFVLYDSKIFKLCDGGKSEFVIFSDGLAYTLYGEYWMNTLRMDVDAVLDVIGTVFEGIDDRYTRLGRTFHAVNNEKIIITEDLLDIRAGDIFVKVEPQIMR